MNIVLGITGSIAAYKACTLIREFVRRGHEVQVVITPAGKEFITPVTLSALTSKPVISDFFAQRDGTWHSHVQLGLWADAMVIAPATASTLAKMAHGVADNMLITTYLSMRAPVFVAPAMDLDMWAHAATQDNLGLLRQRGVTVIEPASGELASHLVGKGRMEEPERIAEVVLGALAAAPAQKDLDGRTILITAGPTYERLDPVRFIGNYSSGKMGVALAEECASRGAKVELVLGPNAVRPQTQDVSITDVESAHEMWEAATRLFDTADAAILCAAVADFTPDTVATQKLRREGDGLTLRLRPTEDIARSLGERKRSGQRLVGFALETHDEREHAREKLSRKNLDFIVLNSLQDEGAGFRHDTNKVTIISPTDEVAYPLKPKREVARDIIDHLRRILAVLAVAMACILPGKAQELNARVSINSSQVENTKSGVFDALQQQVTRFLNERQWTSMQFRESERIQCSFAITVNTYSETDNSFNCSLLVNASRPVYGSGYTTTTITMNDKDLNFNFQEFDQLEWRPEQIESNLTAVLAYWAYMIIGMDLDSFSPMGGTQVFQTAQDICTAADGLGFSGWKAFGDTKNRYAIVNDYMDGALEPLRQMQYDYYRKGLDHMNENTDDARAAITEALKLLKKAHEDKTMSQVPVIFTDFKRDELVSIYSGHGSSSEREAVYDILFRINPSQNTHWEKIKQ